MPPLAHAWETALVILCGPVATAAASLTLARWLEKEEHGQGNGNDQREGDQGREVAPKATREALELSMAFG
jgi:hypothetical protein